MNTFLVVLVCANIVLLLSLSLLLFLKIKEKKEDTRITKGLQLLQHKIAILQDLSDKSDDQVQRLVSILDQKLNEIRKTLKDANQTLQETHRIKDESSLKQHNPKTIEQIKPRETTAMDDFTQFIQAINLQNEKTKNIASESMIIEDSQKVPQNFDISDTDTNQAQTNPGEVKSFEFRRI